MPRREDEELERVHVILYKEDVEKIKVLFKSNIGFSKAVREMVRKFLRHIEAKAGETSSQPQIDIDPDLTP